MIRPRANPRKLEQLFQDLEDGCITGPDHQELMDRLRNSAQARDAYIEHMRFVGALHAKAEALAELGSKRGERDGSETSRLFRRALLSAAALITLALLVGSFLIPAKSPAASWVASPGCVWSVASGGLGEDRRFEPGTLLKIDSGTVQVDFSSGSKIFIEGPAKLSIRGEDDVFLPYGRVWVDAESERFVVVTKRLKVVDMGTRFGVLASLELDEEVHVAEGRVRVEPLVPSLKPMELTTGEALRANVIGRLMKTPFDSTRFQRTLPLVPPFIHWSFDELDQHGVPSNSVGIESGGITIRHLDDRTVSLSPELGTGRFGKALELSGLRHYASSSFSGIEGGLPRTVSLWVKSAQNDEKSFGTLVSWGLAESNGAKWSLGVSDGGTRLSCGWGGVWMGAAASEDGTINCFDGEWHHLAFVYTGQSDPEGVPALKFYLDGIKLETKEVTSVVPIDTDCSAKNSWPLTIGIQPFTNPQRPVYQGKIDELYVFRGVLSDSQIMGLAKDNRLLISD